MDEKTKLELLRLTYDYVVNHRQIDNNFIDKIVAIVVGNSGLDSYVKNLRIYNAPYNPDGDKVLASYNYSLKSLKINLQGSLEALAPEMQMFNFSNFDKTLFLYTSLIRILLHELEHVQQHMVLSNDADSLESSLLRPVLRASELANSDEMIDKLIAAGFSEEQVVIYLLEKQRRYQENYHFSIAERLAEIRSHMKTLEVISGLEISTFNLANYHNLLLCINYLKGYDITDTPTSYYFSKLGLAKEWPKVKISSKPLSFKERIQYGLTISDSEYAVLIGTRDVYKSSLLG